VVMVGGAWKSQIYRELFIEAVLEYDPTLRPTYPPLGMAMGAAYIAMQAYGIEISDELRNRTTTLKGAT